MSKAAVEEEEVELRILEGGWEKEHDNVGRVTLSVCVCRGEREENFIGKYTVWPIQSVGGGTSETRDRGAAAAPP